MLTPEYLHEITDKSESLAARLKRIYHKTDCAEYYGTLAARRGIYAFPDKYVEYTNAAGSLIRFWRIL